MEKILIRSRSEDVYFYKKDLELIARLKLESAKAAQETAHQCGQCGQSMDSQSFGHEILHFCRACESVQLPLNVLTSIREEREPGSVILSWIDTLKHSA